MASNPIYIGQRSLLTGDTVVLTSFNGDPETPAMLVTDGFQDTVWIAQGSGELIVDAVEGEVAANYVSFFVLNPVGVSVSLAYWGEEEDPNVDPPTLLLENEPLAGRLHTLWLDEPISFSHLVLVFYREEGSDGIEVADFRVGIRDEIPSGVFSGFAPPNQARANRVINSRTDRGFLVGRTRVQQAIQTRLDMVYLSEQWVFDHWDYPAADPLADRLEIGSFILGWAPIDLPTHNVLCWTRGEIEPATYVSGTIDLMRISLDIQGVF